MIRIIKSCILSDMKILDFKKKLWYIIVDDDFFLKVVEKVEKELGFSIEFK